MLMIQGSTWQIARQSGVISNQDLNAYVSNLSVFEEDFQWRLQSADLISRNIRSLKLFFQTELSQHPILGQTKIFTYLFQFIREMSGAFPMTSRHYRNLPLTLGIYIPNMCPPDSFADELRKSSS